MRAILLTLACLLPASAGAGHEHTYQPTEKWEWERCAKGWRHRVCHQDRCACVGRGHSRPRPGGRRCRQPPRPNKRRRK